MQAIEPIYITRSHRRYYSLYMVSVAAWLAVGLRLFLAGMSAARDAAAARRAQVEFVVGRAGDAHTKAD